MYLQFNSNETYDQLLNELEESILSWQKEQRKNPNNKFFNAKKYLAKSLNYKDENVVWKFLDPSDTSNAKLGVMDLQKIMEIIDDFTPLKNYITALKKK